MKNRPATIRRLMNVEQVIRRIVIYSATIALLTALNLGVALVSARLFDGSAVHQLLFGAVAIAVLMAVCFQPLKRKIQILVDRRFFRQYADREEKLYELSRDVVSHTTPETMAHALMRVIGGTLRPKAAALYLHSKTAGGFDRVLQIGGPPWPEFVGDDNPLASYFAGHSQPFVQDLPTGSATPFDTRDEMANSRVRA